jgi:hypothetical protein
LDALELLLVIDDLDAMLVALDARLVADGSEMSVHGKERGPFRRLSWGEGRCCDAAADVDWQEISNLARSREQVIAGHSLVW